MARPRVFDSPEEMESSVDEYFAKDEKKTLTGLALHLGFCSRQSVYDYLKDERFSYIINKALLRVENQYEQNLQGNNVAGSIFVLKNMGWKDKTEVESSGGLSLTWKEERTYETK